MTKANELRIGNIVYETSIIENPSVNDFHVFEIAVINNIDGIVRDKDDNISQFDYLYPISLTPEILERCGFKKDKRYSGNQSYSKEDIIIEETNGGYELFASEWTIGETFFYLHELQNICLDLFRFELEIKELQNA